MMVKIPGAAWKYNGSCYIWLMTVLFSRDRPKNKRQRDKKNLMSSMEQLF